MEHVRRLDVEPEDRSTYRQKASYRDFGHRAEGSDIAPRRSKVTGVNMPIEQYVEEDNVPKNQTKR